VRRNIAQSRVTGMVKSKIALSQATIMFFYHRREISFISEMSVICLQGYIHGITLQKTVI
jgi:hypothetical protein